jgi:general L-amino acid transport system permease protein
VINKVEKKFSSTAVPFWRDKRIIPIILQTLFAIGVILAAIYFFNNAIRGMEKIGIKLGFNFLKTSASFDIGEKLIEYTAADSYARALLVGLLNTIKVALIGIILATILGIIIGISRLSNNWLARTVSGLYVEIFRNTPLLVQIFIWYSAVFVRLPRVENSFELPGSIYISNRGFAIPWLEFTSTATVWVILFILGLILSFVLWRLKIKQQVKTGKRTYPLFWAMGSIIAPLFIAWLVTPQSPFTLNFPVLQGFGFKGGYNISPEFAAILFGLVIYTAAFIGEIVRAGIMAVSKGQVEAARALGLKSSTILRLVVFPQAIRIIIPPVTSQYLNLTKNSSLAIAVAYPEIFHVGGTILNQTGRVIEVITIIMVVYLSISLFTSLLMNIFNKYTQLVER